MCTEYKHCVALERASVRTQDCSASPQGHNHDLQNNQPTIPVRNNQDVQGKPQSCHQSTPQLLDN